MTQSSKETKAVALTYDGNKAPVVSASGSSELAEEILKIAREHEVPIYENEQLVETLAMLEVGDEIPELLYRTIAEIIAFVYLLKGKMPAGYSTTKEKAPNEAPENSHQTEENNKIGIGTTMKSLPHEPVKRLPGPQNDSEQTTD